MNILFLAIGFILLLKGADLFVDGSSSAAKLLKVPSVIIGLTIVAMGTSAPEAAVSISAGLQGNSDIALSNIIGSNIFNLLVVTGVCAAMKSFVPDRSIMKRDMPVHIVVTILLLVFMLNRSIGRIEGIILLLGMATYLFWMVRTALKNRTDTEEIKALSPVRSIIYILAGLAMVVIGGDLVVEHASAIAAALGLSQTLIGLTIVAVGTSLPELVTSIVAARKGENGLALGNVIGSNIFNILFILGASSALQPIRVSLESIIDIVILLVFALVMTLFCRTGQKLSRREGIICVLFYAGYLAYIILR